MDIIHIYIYIYLVQLGQGSIEPIHAQARIGTETVDNKPLSARVRTIFTQVEVEVNSLGNVIVGCNPSPLGLEDIKSSDMYIKSYHATIVQQYYHSEQDISVHVIDTMQNLFLKKIFKRQLHSTVVYPLEQQRSSLYFVSLRFFFFGGPVMATTEQRWRLHAYAACSKRSSRLVLEINLPVSHTFTTQKHIEILDIQNLDVQVNNL